MPRATAQANWAKAAPRRRRARWHPRPRRADASANDAGLDDPAWAESTAVVRIAEVVEPLPPQYEQQLMWRSRQLMRAARLWAPDYRLELEKEKGEVPELWEHVTNLFKVQVSTYRLRLKDERLLLRYDAKTERMVRDHVDAAKISGAAVCCAPQGLRATAARCRTLDGASPGAAQVQR